MSNIGEKVLIGENEFNCLYTTSVTRTLTDSLEKPDIRGVTFHNWLVAVMESKMGKGSIYILFDQDNNPIEVDDTIEGLACKMDMLRLVRGDVDIRDIVESGEFPHTF